MYELIDIFSFIYINIAIFSESHKSLNSNREFSLHTVSSFPLKMVPIFLFYNIFLVIARCL